MKRRFVAPECVRSLVIDILNDPHADRSCGGRRIRVETGGQARRFDSTPFELVCGDPQDCDSDHSYLGNGILVSTSQAGVIEIRTSISGFPILYVCEHRNGTSYSTSPSILLERQEDSTALDWSSVLSLGTFGRTPVGQTIFRGISIMPPGRCVRVSANGVISAGAAFRPTGGRLTSLSEYVASQCETLRRAIQRMDLSRSVLSLTAGLDTRAILAVIAEQDRTIDSVTLCGYRDSIDVRRAAELSRLYGLEHTVVRLDEEYEAHLPEMCREVSLRTGGLASFEQAPDLHMYRTLGGRYTARLSGLLGNQVGRSGVEGVSVRGADLGILGPESLDAHDIAPDSHWLVGASADRGLNSPDFLITVESLYASMANYSLGSSGCLQQSPYADREVISNCLLAPDLAVRKSVASIRLADLHHRFLGRPSSHSFQRQLIVHVGGHVSSCAVNWGWKPTGGVSIAAACLGLVGFLDASLSVAGRRFPGLSRARSTLGIEGLAEIERRPYLYRSSMPTFVRDTLLGRDVLESGLFERGALQRLIDRDYFDHRSYSTVVFALDMALAWKEFIARRAHGTRAESWSSGLEQLSS